jgi:transitional endoplasmic reticulum ATPase
VTVGKQGAPAIDAAGARPGGGQDASPPQQRLSREQVQWQRAEATAVRVSGGQAVTVRAALAQPGDVGRGRVRVHPSVAAQRDLSDGDAVVIEGLSGRGSQRAFAGVTLDELQPRETAAIDGLLRRAAGVGLGEPAGLRKVAAGQALAIRAERASPGSAFKSTELASLLDGVVTGPGGLVQAHGLLLRVSGATPDGPVRIDRQTVIQVEEAASPFTDTGVWYEDIGGLDLELARIREIVELPLLRPELFRRLGVIPPRGVLLHGAPGTGKTLLARAVANECRANFVHINGPDLMHKFYGESEQRLRQLFEDAAAQAPSIIFIDEIDAIAPKRAEVLGEMEKRVVAQFLALMDGFVSRGQVVVIGATNLPQALDPALRRPGRFDREVEIGQPDRSARLAILKIHTRAMPLAEDVDLSGLAARTSGFVGADLEALAQEAGMAAIRRLSSSACAPAELVTEADFLEAFHAVEPTAAREIMREQTVETFANVGGYEQLKASLRTIFSRPGLSRGVLLEGPSGVGKTLLARATAGELGLPLIAVDGPLLYSKWLGESEKALADIFAKARHNAPCLLLLDQLEAIGDSRLEQMQRMVGQLVRELDGIAAFPEVAVIAATNRAELIDPAVKRRFDYIFDVGLPGEEDREAIWRLHLSSLVSSSEARQPFPEAQAAAASLALSMTKPSQGMTGADIAAAVRRARLAVIAAEGQPGTRVSELQTYVQEALCPFITR